MRIVVGVARAAKILGALGLVGLASACASVAHRHTESEDGRVILAEATSDDGRYRVEVIRTDTGALEIYRHDAAAGTSELLQTAKVIFDVDRVTYDDGVFYLWLDGELVLEMR